MKFGNSQRVVGYQSGFDQYSDALGSWEEAANIFRDNKERKRRQGMEDLEFGKAMETAALRIKMLEDELAARPEERDLARRRVDAGIRGIDADIAGDAEARALRARAFDADEEERKRRIAEDARARDARTATFKVLAGGEGGQLPVSSAQPGSGWRAPMLPPGQGPSAGGDPDEIEISEYDAETKALTDALSGSFGDLDEASQKALLGPLMETRLKGRNKLGFGQAMSIVDRLTAAGWLDPAQAQTAKAQLTMGVDPVEVAKGFKGFAAAKEKSLADEAIRASALQEATNILGQLPALNVRLKPRANAEINALMARLQNPLLSGEDALRVSDSIRKIAFSDAASDGETAWYDNSSIVAILKDPMGGSPAQRLADAKALARGLGLPGVPMDAAPTQAASGGNPAAAGVEAVPDDVLLIEQLREKLGREPTEDEAVAALATQAPLKVSDAGAPVPLSADEKKARDEDLLRKAASGKRLRPDEEARLADIEARRDKRRFVDVSPSDSAALLGVLGGKPQVVKNEPGQYTEAEARRMHAQDPRMRFKRNPKGGYDLVARNDVARNTDPKREYRNE